MARLGRSQPIQAVRLAARIPSAAPPGAGSGTGTWSFAGTGVGDDGTVKLRANALGRDGENNTSTTPIVIPADAGTDGTDYAVVALSASAGTTPTVTSAPSGWTLLSGPQTTGGHRAYLYGKTIAPGEPGTTVTWTWSNSFATVPGHMAVYRNVTATGMLVGTPNVDNVAGTTIDIPSLASVPAGALVHVHFALKSAVASTPDVTTPAGYSAGASARSASVGFSSAEHAYKVASTAGTYGGETATVDSSTFGVVYIVALPNANTKSGSGTGTWTFAGTGTGTRAPQGSGTGAWSFAGTGSGTRPPKATGAGTWTFTGAGTGATVRSGTGTGTWTFVGTGTGAFVAQGTGSGTWTFVGTGEGIQPTTPGHIAGTALLAQTLGTAVLTGVMGTAILASDGQSLAVLASETLATATIDTA